jgi:hypothetical protein
MTKYPLTWPAGWKRTPPAERRRAQFKKKSWQTGGFSKLSVDQGTARILYELERLGARDVIISTNIKLRYDGLPRSDQKEPEDPGVAVYWKDAKGKDKSMPEDQYDRVADNLAALAATLEAFRTIQRHGGAPILDRAFTGFEALPAPRDWKVILGLSHLEAPMQAQAKEAYRRLCQERHPDRGGTHEQMAELNWAWDQAQQELGG